MPVKISIFLIFILFSACGQKNQTFSAGNLESQAFDNSDQKLSYAGSVESQSDSAHPESIAVNLKVIPSSANSGYQPQYFFNKVLETNKSITLNYHNTAMLHGSCIQENAPETDQADDKKDMGCDILVTLPAKPGEEIFQEPIRINTTLTGEFNVELLTGRKYKLIFNPNGNNQNPPTSFDVRLDKTRYVPFELPSSHHLLTGNLTYRHTANHSTLIFPKKEVFKLRVLDGNKLISSTTRAHFGEKFKIFIGKEHLLDSKNSDFKLEISPTSESYFPTYNQPLRLSLDTNETKIHTSDYLSSKEPVDASFKLRRHKELKLENISFAIKSASEQASYSKSAEFKEDGSTTLRLSPGDYHYAVIPGISSPMRPYIRSSKSIDEGFIKKISFKKRAPIKIKILGPKLTPVKGATIALQLKKSDSKKINLFSEFFSRTTQLFSNENGNLCAATSREIQEEHCGPIFLEEGHYQVDIQPPPGEKFAHLTKNIDITDEEISNGTNISLPATKKFSGEILDTTGQKPIIEALVKIFSADKKTLLGKAYTDEFGKFTAYLPILK